MTNEAQAQSGELPRLVSSNRVEGTLVLSRDGDKLGTVTAFLIDRYEGQVEYLIVAMGGVLGMGVNYHPVPWTLAKFDQAREGYVISIDKGVLSSGPSFKSGADQLFDRAYTDRVLNYHGLGGPRSTSSG
jgi:hypothetical protein